MKGFMGCKINSKEDNARLESILGNLDENDLRIVENAGNEAYQTGFDRAGIIIGGTITVACFICHFVGNAIIKKKLNS